MPTINTMRVSTPKSYATILFAIIGLQLPCMDAFSLSSYHGDPISKRYAIGRKPGSLQSSSNDSSFDMSELSRRIEGLQTADNLLGDGTGDGTSVVLDLPVIAFDSLLPNQRMSGRTSDITFARMLARLGLGGLFCMVSVNHTQRKIRRNGVVCRIELIDAPNADGVSSNGNIMTAVDFQLVGLRRCRVVGIPEGMKARIGRWRRQYDPDGEESVLGFGEERFVDVDEENASMPTDLTVQPEKMKGLSYQEWSYAQVDCAIEDADNNQEEVVQKAESLIPLLEKWQQLASDVQTYDNTDVVASSRVMKGQPGLRVDPAALIRKVIADLGKQPSPTDPVAFALWGTGLINPVPELGCSPEIRGRVLEAPDAMTKLKILEWGAKKSIANLNGSAPL